MVDGCKEMEENQMMGRKKELGTSSQEFKLKRAKPKAKVLPQYESWQLMHLLWREGIQAAGGMS